MNDDDVDDRVARGSRNEETRQRNLALMLSSVHGRGALSRAELTRHSGLNRSTVGFLVAELVELGLVLETEPSAERRVGRPSPVVVPSPDVVAIAINPDVAGLTAGVVGLGGDVRMRETILTPEIMTPEDAVLLTGDFVARVAAELPDSTRVAGIGVAVPGLVDERNNSVAIAPYLGWHDEAFAAMLEEELALPTWLSNDSTLGVVAESRYGAGVGCENVMYLNGSTSGLGGGVISEGRLMRGAHGFGIELGHILLDRDGAPCPCGRTGCLETVVNVRRIWSVAGRGVMDLPELDDLYLNSPGAAIEAELDIQADALAAGIASLVCVFGSERVILGGHVGSLLEARGDRIRAEVARQAFGPLGRDLTIVRNGLRERMVHIGAAELAFGPLLNDPAHAPLFHIGALRAEARR
ncbi:MAG: ROK family transcriptional regulator [Demequinaceae bacterium]|nr:ROK family transcriptional regulator [Demequinaceae bacterium]